MRKMVLSVAALALVSGIAAYAIACEKDAKATSAEMASAGAAKTASLSGDHCGQASAASVKSSSACGTKSASLASSGSSCASKHSAALASGPSCANKKSGAAAAAAHGCSDLVFAVNDMGGECCIESIEKALTGVKGVQAVYVDVDARRAYACSGEEKVNAKNAVKSLKKAGYKQAKYVGTDEDHCAHALSTSEAKTCHPKVEKTSKI